MTTEVDKCYSTNNEQFDHSDLSDVLTELDDDGRLEPGVVIYEADAFKRPAGFFFDIDMLFENMGESAHDAGGEYADDFPDVSEGARAELEDIIKNWLDRNVEVRFYSVRNARPIEVTAAMIAEHRA